MACPMELNPAEARKAAQNPVQADLTRLRRDAANEVRRLFRCHPMTWKEAKDSRLIRRVIFLLRHAAKPPHESRKAVAMGRTASPPSTPRRIV